MSSSSQPHTQLAPNHHGDHEGFSGLAGWLFALAFSVGRADDADLALRLTGAGPGDDVLDIGCGPGVAVRRAAARDVASAVGVDPSREMLGVARAGTRLARRARGVRYLEGSVESLPLPDASVSVAWSIATVHHWHDLDAGLAEVRRVLRPQGRFLAIERLVDPTASGHASHGWSEVQSERFVERCLDAGFTDPQTARAHSRRRDVLTVLVRAA